MDEIIKISEEQTNIKYMGIVPNEQIIQAEIKATLLVNPRPSNKEYTKYSFPSKNMEYMSSGTPVLTTKLPGMPEDHLQYVFLFENESIEGMSKSLREILMKSKNELHEKGIKAKEFILNEKNNVKQAQKLIEMLKFL